MWLLLLGDHGTLLGHGILYLKWVLVWKIVLILRMFIKRDKEKKYSIFIVHFDMFLNFKIALIVILHEIIF